MTDKEPALQEMAEAAPVIAAAEASPAAEAIAPVKTAAPEPPALEPAKPQAPPAIAAVIAEKAPPAIAAVIAEKPPALKTAAAHAANLGKPPAAVAKTFPVAKPVPAKPPVRRFAARARAFAGEYGFTAASVALALGCGWLVGANTFDGGADARRIAGAVLALDAKLDAAVARLAPIDDLAALRDSAGQTKTGLDATRNNVAAAVAQLTSKFDRLDREQGARMDRLAERMERVERAASAPQPTATISQLPAPAPPAPVALPANPGETRVPQSSGAETPLPAYVLRQVRGGAALVESRAGLREVLPGDNLPGAGTVRAIERRGRQWVVVTSAGIIGQRGY